MAKKVDKTIQKAIRFPVWVAEAIQRIADENRVTFTDVVQKLLRQELALMGYTMGIGREGLDRQPYEKQTQTAKPLPVAGEVREIEPVYGADVVSISGREEIKGNIVLFDLGVIEVPLRGSTAAGKPVDFGDLDPEPPARPWAAPLIRGDREDYYCVLVKGSSMTEAGIADGDYALLKHAKIAESGEIMLVRHENESTLKRVRIVEGKNGEEEVFICWEDGSGHKEKLDREDYEIQGKLVAIDKKPGRR